MNKLKKLFCSIFGHNFVKELSDKQCMIPDRYDCTICKKVKYVDTEC